MRHTILIASAGAALLAACTANPDGAAQPQATAASDTYYLRAGMVEQINPPMEAMWNMQVDVMDDFGNFDPALMTVQNWTELQAHARGLAAAADRMAVADSYVAADPGGPYADAPEGTDLAAIQMRLDTQTAAYRAFSQNFARHAAQLVAAANAQDAATVTQLVNDMQPQCKACHDVFWYPEEYQP
jgi:hypothetical protein